MKRQVKSATDEFRVLSFGVDVVVPADMDASEVENMLYDAQTSPFKGKARIAGVDFKQDLTDWYENSGYAGEMFIH